MLTEQDKDFSDYEILRLLSETLRKSHFWTNTTVMVNIRIDRVFNTTVTRKVHAGSALFCIKKHSRWEKLRKKQAKFNRDLDMTL